MEEGGGSGNTKGFGSKLITFYVSAPWSVPFFRGGGGWKGCRAFFEFHRFINSVECVQRSVDDCFRSGNALKKKSSGKINKSGKVRIGNSP